MSPFRRIDPRNPDAAATDAHIDMEARAQPRFGTSPCALAIQVDFAVHRVLPAMIRQRLPVLAARLEDTSPRWGRRSRAVT